MATNATLDRVGQTDLYFFATENNSLGDALGRAAVVPRDHDVLRDVGQLTRQVTGVGRLQRRVGQTLAGTVRAGEVLEHRQPFAEVGLDGRLNNLAARLGHQAPHAAELPHLLLTTTGTRVGHQVDWVNVLITTEVDLQAGHHLVGDLLISVRPLLKHLGVTLALGDDAALVVLVELQHLLFGGGENFLFRLGRHEVVRAKRQAAGRRRTEARLIHVVQQLDRAAAAEELVAVADHLRQFARLHRQVVERHAFGKHLVEEAAADGRLDHATRFALLAHLFAEITSWLQADFNLGVRMNLAKVVGHLNFFKRRELHPIARRFGHIHRDVVAAHHHVLRRANDWRAVGRAEDVVSRHHQRVRFDLRFNRQWQMHRHLVAIEVRIKTFAHQRVQVDRVAFDQCRFKRLDSHPVQRRRPVEQHRMVGDHLFENVPNFLILPLEHLLGRLDRVGVTKLLEAANDERLVKFERNFLRQSTLMQIELRADHDHTPSRVVDSLAEQVLTEPALLTLNHVGQRLERAVRRTEHRPLAAVVVEQGVDTLL